LFEPHFVNGAQMFSLALRQERFGCFRSFHAGYRERDGRSVLPRSGHCLCVQAPIFKTFHRPLDCRVILGSQDHAVA
jgi:hypothetical protein